MVVLLYPLPGLGFNDNSVALQEASTMNADWSMARVVAVYLLDNPIDRPELPGKAMGTVLFIASYACCALLLNLCSEESELPWLCNCASVLPSKPKELFMVTVDFKCMTSHE